MSTTQRWSMYTGFALLGLLILSLLFPLFFLPFNAFTGDSPWGWLFLEFISRPDGPVPLIQGLIPPIISGGLVTVMWSDRDGQWAKAAIIVTGIGVLGCFVLWYWLGQSAVAANLWQTQVAPPGVDLLIKDAASFETRMQAYYSGAWKMLVALIGALIGAQFTPKTSST
ncbi:hypothetical protein [Asticcacaulis excentricus]|nr:hypothetical protein [Asticcacaulis excentricus]